MTGIGPIYRTPNPSKCELETLSYNKKQLIVPAACVER